MYSISLAVSFLEMPTKTHRPRPIELIVDPSTEHKPSMLWKTKAS